LKSVVERIFLKSHRATELIPITSEVQEAASKSGVRNGLVNVFTQHVTTAVTVNENDPKLEADIARFMEEWRSTHIHTFEQACSALV
jgi:secondary thiamine-phosphate synthase enzyme